MNSDLNQREQLSALADGELRATDCVAALAYADTDAGRAQWLSYHVIGDVMRSSELARQTPTDWVTRLNEQLAQEARRVPWMPADATSVVAPVASAHAVAPAANADVFRWKMVAGVASMAAVAAIGWQALTGLQGGVSGAQLAQAPAALVLSQPQTVAVAGDVPSDQAVMIRDARLDDLLAAHKQYGSTSSLQMPAGFLRNATFEAPAR